MIFSKMRLYYRWWRTWKQMPVFAWIKAAANYKAGRYEIAADLYKKGMISHPEHPAKYSASLDLAYCLFKLRKFDEAQEELRFIIKHQPNISDAHLRLARIQSWIGHSLDAAWTARRALQKLTPDPEFVSAFLLNVIGHDGTDYLLQEALNYADNLSAENKEHVLMQTAYAKLAIHQGDKESGREKLLDICAHSNCPFEAIILLAELLLEDGSIAQARHELKRAMNVVSDHPRVLSLIAESYLKSGPFYNAEYARQLSTSACQNSQWASPRELHILAEAFFHCGDKISALVLASKAKQTGSKLLGTYRDVKNLDRLIETLSTGTQA